jgi:TnpA family transposase
MVEGLVRHCTDAEIESNYVDILYRFRTRRSGIDLQFGRAAGLGRDRGLCLFVCCI